jgi:hypothetical protein
MLNCIAHAVSFFFSAAGPKLLLPRLPLSALSTWPEGNRPELLSYGLRFRLRSFTGRPIARPTLMSCSNLRSKASRPRQNFPRSKRRNVFRRAAGPAFSHHAPLWV